MRIFSLSVGLAGRLRSWRRILAACVLVMLVPALVFAQFSLRRRSSQEDITVAYDSHFVFTRIRYNAGSGLARGFFGGDGWAHDYPTADRNLSAILDYITNMRVRLDGSNILDLDDEAIFENPILYMSEPGGWSTTDEEATNLRAYLLKGGLIIFDDFEGDYDWRNLVAQMRRALPDHYFVPIDVTHPVFHSFFDIKELNVPHPLVNVPPGYRAIFENNDPAGRMLALANWNNDLGDYWEWSAEGLYGTDPTNDAYRLGVNYIVYALTH
jgi:hypothetical protein